MRDSRITGDEVRARREALGLTRTELYSTIWEMIGLEVLDSGRSTVYQWEREGGQPPAWVTLALDVLEHSHAQR
jgi:DNA-binding transcriptional regulator YiaG